MARSGKVHRGAPDNGCVPDPEDAKTRIRKWLASQGYQLEYSTATALREERYVVEQGRTYRDPSSDKTREIDLVAYPYSPLAPRNPAATVAIAVECKRSDAPWLVRKADLSGEQLAWHPIASQLLAAYLVGEGRVGDAMAVAGPTGFDVVSVRGEGRRSGDDPAWAALAQAVAAARGTQPLEEQRDQRASWVYPVVVLDGPLYSLWYPDGREELEAAAWERVIWSGSDLPGPTAIDIVTRDEVRAHGARLAALLTRVQSKLPAGRIFLTPAASFV
jgi:hypothetical protein